MSTSANPPVSIPDAITMTTNWREYYGNITGTDPNQAFRAFKIPLEDIKRMLDLANEDPSINAVRAYLALGEPAGNQVIDPNTVHILLLPVRNDGGSGIDILEVQKGPVAVSTIMDFTQPCPMVCDFTSPLYGPVIE